MKFYKFIPIFKVMEKVQDTISIKYGIITRHENGIVSFKAHPEYDTVTLDTLKEMYGIFTELAEETPFPYLSDNRGLKNIGKQEKVFIRNTFHHFACAAAIIVESPVERFMHHIFMYLYKPKIPVKQFSEHKEAMKWLEQYCNI